MLPSWFAGRFFCSPLFALWSVRRRALSVFPLFSGVLFSLPLHRLTDLESCRVKVGKADLCGCLFSLCFADVQQFLALTSRSKVGNADLCGLSPLACSSPVFQAAAAVLAGGSLFVRCPHPLFLGCDILRRLFSRASFAVQRRGEKSPVVLSGVANDRHDGA